MDKNTLKPLIQKLCVSHSGEETKEILQEFSRLGLMVVFRDGEVKVFDKRNNLLAKTSDGWTIYLVQ